MARNYGLTFVSGLFIGYVVGQALISFHPNTISSRVETLFVYGTLTNPIIRTLACQCVVDASPSTLVGYKKVGLNIVKTGTSTVPGEIINITSTELERLDSYERVPQRYIRTEVEINNENVWVYMKP